MNIRPLYDRIVVKRIENEETLQGGMYIPDSAKKKPQEGEVVAVGDGIPMGGVLVPMPVAVGDVVDYSEYGVEQVWEHPRDRFDNTKPTYYRVRVADVYGVVSAS